MPNLKYLRERIRAMLAKGRRCLSQLAHRIGTEPGYADALASVVVAAVSLTCLRPAVVRFIKELAQTFAELIRTLIRNRNGYTALGWDDVGPGWD